MRLHSTTTWQDSIRLYATIMIAVVASLAIALIGFVLTDRVRTEVFLKIQDDYHLTSALAATSSELVIDSLLGRLELLREHRDRLAEGGITEREVASEVRSSLFILGQKVSGILEAQAAYQDADFDNLTKRLSRQKHELEGTDVSIGISPQLIQRLEEKLGTIRLTLNQLARLHVIVHDTRQAHHLERNRNSLRLLVGVFAVAALLAFFAINRGFEAISGLTESQNISATRLRDSEQRFRDYAVSSADMYWQTDAELHLQWTDPSSSIETSGNSISAVEHSALAIDNDKLRPLLEAREPIRNVEIQVSDGAQGHRWWRVSGVPIFDDTDAFVGYRGVATDITELVQSKAQNARANERLAGAVEGLDEVFSLWDDDDRLVFGNRVFRELNKNIPELIVPGTSFESYLRGGVDSGQMRDLAGQEAEFMAQSIARRHAPNAEAFEIQRTDGVVLRLREQKLDGGGIVTIGQDVTQQRRNEEALRASEERLALAVQRLSIWDWDLRTDSLYMSPGFGKILGYTADEFDAIKRASLATIIHPDDLDNYRAKLDEHLQDQSLAFSNEHRFRMKSGEYKWFLAIGQSVVDEDGHALRSTGVLTDITERVELEDRLLKAQKMEAIGNLTGGIAHDFNNLLSIILGNLELIKDFVATQEAERCVDAGIKAATRGADLVKNMLSFARQSRLELQSTDLNQIINETESWCARVIPENIELELSLAADLWGVETDPALAQNAILNLILNARDAMSSGGTLAVRTTNVHVANDHAFAQDESFVPGDYVVLEVSDTGEGIPETNLESIFQPFFTTKPPGSGSGLGLSMVQGFMKQSGGMVRVHSEPGVRTTFKLFFRAMASDERAPCSDGKILTPAQPMPATIFLVEDEPAVLEVLTKTLNEAGYQVCSAKSGDEAIADIREDVGFDLLITDLVMPGITQGTQLAREFRNRRPDLPVIFMSGYAKDPMSRRNDLRARDIQLMKPFSRSEIVEAVEMALAGGSKDRTQPPNLRMNLNSD